MFIEHSTNNKNTKVLYNEYCTANNNWLSNLLFTEKDRENENEQRDPETEG